MRRTEWAFLGLLGLIGGGPTFIGTLVGQRFVSETVSVAFLGLAAGSILYVVIELLAVARRADLKMINTWGVFLGVLTGFATDAIITAADIAKMLGVSRATAYRYLSDGASLSL